MENHSLFLQKSITQKIRIAKSLIALNFPNAELGNIEVKKIGDD